MDAQLEALFGDPLASAVVRISPVPSVNSTRQSSLPANSGDFRRTHRSTSVRIWPASDAVNSFSAAIAQPALSLAVTVAKKAPSLCDGSGVP